MELSGPILAHHALTSKWKLLNGCAELATAMISSLLDAIQAIDGSYRLDGAEITKVVIVAGAWVIQPGR